MTAGQDGSTPILQLDGVGLDAMSPLTTRRVDLLLAPGDLVLVDAGAPEVEAALVDVALGIAAPRDGTARVRGHDWREMPRSYAAAVRGTIGLIPRRGGWLGHLPTAANLLLKPRYHQRTPTPALLDDAHRLAARFLLPGVPLDPVAAMHPRDRLRTACVRAFLAEPSLVVVETPFDTTWGTLLEPLVTSLQEVCERGGAVLWCLTEDPLFDEPTLPAVRRVRLRERLQTAVPA